MIARALAGIIAAALGIAGCQPVASPESTAPPVPMATPIPLATPASLPAAMVTPTPPDYTPPPPRPLPFPPVSHLHGANDIVIEIREDRQRPTRVFVGPGREYQTARISLKVMGDGQVLDDGQLVALLPEEDVQELLAFVVRDLGFFTWPDTSLRAYDPTSLGAGVAFGAPFAPTFPPELWVLAEGRVGLTTNALVVGPVKTRLVELIARRPPPPSPAAPREPPTPPLPPTPGAPPSPPLLPTPTVKPTPTPTPTTLPVPLPRVVTLRAAGTVYDLEKGPAAGIPGAVVIGTFGLESTSRRVKTDSSGRYSLSGSGHSANGNTVRLIVVADGYAPLRLTCQEICDVGLAPLRGPLPTRPWDPPQVSIEGDNVFVSVRITGDPQGMSFLLVGASSSFVPVSGGFVGATRTEWFRGVRLGDYSLLVTDGIGNIFAQTIVLAEPPPTPMPRSTPKGSPTPLPTPLRTATPTPGVPCPVPEWTLQEVHVEGSSVTVVVSVIVGHPPRIELDGQLSPDVTSQVANGRPTIKAVFTSVAAGSHTLRVTDGCTSVAREVVIGG